MVKGEASQPETILRAAGGVCPQPLRHQHNQSRSPFEHSTVAAQEMDVLRLEVEEEPPASVSPLLFKLSLAA
jgi:hypothetical protein